MALQLITHSADGTKQIATVKSGSQTIKANSNIMYELRDTSTKKAPQKANAVKKGKNLEIDTLVDGQNSHIIIEDYYSVNNSQLIGDLGNGEYYPLLADGSPVVPTSELAHTASNSASYAGYGSDFANVGAVASTGTSWASYALGAAAVAGGGVAAAGGGGSKSSAPTTTTPTVPTNAPTATISMTDTVLNSGDLSEVRVVFSEKVIGFTNSDITVSNGTLSTFTSSDGITYTAIFTPTADISDTTNIITLAQGSYTSESGVAGNGATSANYTIDTTVPPPSPVTVAISDNESGIANIAGGSVLYTFKFSEPVIGFGSADVVVENGTKGIFNTVDSSTYTLEITPSANTSGNMTVSVPAGAANSIANGTSSNASSISTQQIDTVAPTVVSATLADTALTAGETTEFTVIFSEKVTSFSNANLDTSAANGTLSTMSSNDGGITWKGLFTPNTNINDATNVIQVLNTYSDAASNSGSLARSGNFTIDTTVASGGTTPPATDTTKPTLIITDDEAALRANMDGDGDANGSDILYTFTFDEPVVDFIASDILVAHGTAGTFTKVSDKVYTLMVTPTPGFEGNMSVEVTRDKYHDAAGNAGSDNSDIISNQIVDMRAPFPEGINDPAVTSITADPTNHRLILTFDENLEQVNQSNPTSFRVTINGFEVPVLAVGVSDNTAGMEDNQVFLYLGSSFDPTAGISVLYTDADTDVTPIIQDLAGNDATSFFDSTADTLTPTATITMSDTVLASGDVSVVTFKFSEKVMNFGLDDIDVTNANGTFENLRTTDNITWTADFKATVGVDDTSNMFTLNNTYTDASNNAGTVSSSENYIVDTKAPVLQSYTGNGTNDTITLTFDEVLDAVNFAPGSMFTVTDGTPTPAADDGAALVQYAVTSVAIDGNQAILSIDPAVLSDAGTTWKLTYNDPSGNTPQALQDLYGSDVSSFAINVVL